MVGTLIAVRRPRDVDGAVIEQEPGALIVRSRVERDVVLRIASVARADDARLNDQGTAGPLARRRECRWRGAAGRTSRSPSCETTKYIVCDTGSMTGVPTMPMLPAKSIRSTGLADIGAGHGHDAGRGVRVVDAPERRRRRRIVGVERVDAVVVGRDVHDVADAETRNVHALDVQGLHVDLVVDGALEEFAELADVDVRRRQNRLGEVGARPGRVVVLGGHARLRECRLRQKQRARKSERRRCPGGHRTAHHKKRATRSRCISAPREAAHAVEVARPPHLQSKWRKRYAELDRLLELNFGIRDPGSGIRD